MSVEFFVTSSSSLAPPSGASTIGAVPSSPASMQLTSSRGPSSITSETVVTVESSHTGKAEFLRRGPTVVCGVALLPPQAAIIRADARARDTANLFDILVS